ncbi:CbiX/SirB N-terminal domain-containing protein [Halanaerocella petrolearia]
MEEAVIVVAHGSKSQESNLVFTKLVEMVQQRLADKIVKQATVEFSGPTLEEVVAKLVEEKVEQVTIMPLFLFPGFHVQNQIPKLIEELKVKYPKLKFNILDSIGANEELVDIIQNQVE